MRLFSWLALAGSAVFAVVAIAGSGTPSKKGIADASRGYTEWKAANEKLFQVSPQVWILCRPPSPAEQKLMDSDPHPGFIKVFVSPGSEAAMVSRKPFPVGTVLVKERHKTETSSAEFCTVMRKREKGYNPACGDWEFAILNPEGKATQEGKLKDCMACHAAQTKLDYTFRTYLPNGKGDFFRIWQVAAKG